MDWRIADAEQAAEKDRVVEGAVAAEVAVKPLGDAEREAATAQWTVRVALELVAGAEVDGARMMVALIAFGRPAS